MREGRRESRRTEETNRPHCCCHISLHLAASLCSLLLLSFFLSFSLSVVAGTFSFTSTPNHFDSFCRGNQTDKKGSNHTIRWYSLSPLPHTLSLSQHYTPMVDTTQSPLAMLVLVTPYTILYVENEQQPFFSSVFFRHPRLDSSFLL